MKTIVASLGLALVVFTGCQTPSSQLNQVHLGMDEPQVVKILGQPASRAESRNGMVTLYYTLRENGSGTINAPYSVKFIDGKVDSYGRDGQPQTSQVTPVVVPMAHP